MNEQPNWREEGGEVLPPNVEPDVPHYQTEINRRDLDEMHPNFAPNNPTENTNEPESPTPLFRDNDKELDDAIGRHPANGSQNQDHVPENPYWPSRKERSIGLDWIRKIREETLKGKKPQDSDRNRPN